ncbi:MAG: hypothetical protein JW893_04850 [Candidatus Omnitrophica bacterium]|nr:hypothetical protein [Candidatus Omnitrophota bacterium]
MAKGKKQNKSSSRVSIIRLGNRLFRWRRWFYLLPVSLMIFYSENLKYLFKSYVYDELFEIASFGVVALGLAIRFWASGSSHRSFVKKEKEWHFHSQTQGVFSIVRNPYFVGEFFILLGLSLPLLSLRLVLLSLFLFLLLYTPIVLSRERMLEDRFKEAYEAYRRKIPLCIPSFRHWEKGRVHFRWDVALEKETNIIVIVSFFCFFIEQYKDIIIKGAWDSQPIWLILMLPAIFLLLLQSALTPALCDYSDMPEILD